MTAPVGDSSAAGWTAVAVAATAATTAAATCALLWLRPHSGGDGGGGTAPTRLSVRIGTGTTPVPYREPCWMAAAARRLGWRDYQPPVAKLRLGHLPTPLHRWELPGAPDSCEVWIKRDDCTGSELSGNKIRKLEFLLAEALESGCDTVITVGGIQSNHCRATAAAARRLGLIPHIILRTVDPSSDPGLVGNLMVDRMVGAEIHLVGEEEFAKKGGWGLVCELREKLTREEGRKVYAFPSGGSNGLGAWGYIEAIAELECQQQQQQQQQAEAAAAGGAAAGAEPKMGELDAIYFACGSGGTAAGLALGVHLSAMRAELVGLGVDDTPQEFHDKITGQIFGELGIVGLRSEEILRLEDHVGEGYAQSTQAELKFVVEVARRTGVVLDPVYSGKAALGMLEDVRRRGYKRVLFFHTGGLLGLYAKEAQLAPLLQGGWRNGL